MTASLLAQGMRSLQRPVELYIVHMEAGREEEAFREIQGAMPEFNPKVLQRGHQFEL